MQPASRTIAKIWCEKLKATRSRIHFRTSQHEESWATQRPQMNGYTMRQVTTTPNWQQKWKSVEQWATRSGVQFETTCHAIRWKHQSWNAWQWMQQQNTQIWHTIVMTTWHLRSRMGVHIVLAEPASQLELNIAACRRSWLGNRWNPSIKQINETHTVKQTNTQCAHQRMSNSLHGYDLGHYKQNAHHGHTPAQQTAATQWKIPRVQHECIWKSIQSRLR